MTKLGQQRASRRERFSADIGRAIQAAAGERSRYAPAEAQAISTSVHTIREFVLHAIRAHWRVSPRRA